MRPRVCLFTASVEPSGVGEHLLTLAAELRARYDLAVVCPPHAPGRRLLARARALGVEACALDVRTERRPAATLRHWLQAQRFDLFHCHAGIFWEGALGAAIAREAGVPVVRTEHAPHRDPTPRNVAMSGALSGAVDRLICVSAGVGASFLAIGVPAEKLRIVRNGIAPLPSRSRATVDRATVRARLGLPTAARLVLTVGRLDEQKGHRTLLGAAPTVLRGAPDVRFLWVGRGPLEDELRAHLRARDLEERVQVLGRRDDVPDVLAAADLFVLPSRFEGLPLAALEAMRAGLPVVGTRVCGIDEVVRDGQTGRLVPPLDAAALASAILEALGDPRRAACWGRAGRVLVARAFGAARMARETAAIYDELLGRRDPAPRAWPAAAPARAREQVRGGGT